MKAARSHTGLRAALMVTRLGGAAPAPGALAELLDPARGAALALSLPGHAPLKLVPATTQALLLEAALLRQAALDLNVGEARPWAVAQSIDAAWLALGTLFPEAARASDQARAPGVPDLLPRGLRALISDLAAQLLCPAPGGALRGVHLDTDEAMGSALATVLGPALSGWLQVELSLREQGAREARAALCVGLGGPLGAATARLSRPVDPARDLMAAVTLGLPSWSVAGGAPDEGPQDWRALWDERHGPGAHLALQRAWLTGSVNQPEGSQPEGGQPEGSQPWSGAARSVWHLSSLMRVPEGEFWTLERTAGAVSPDARAALGHLSGLRAGSRRWTLIWSLHRSAAAEQAWAEEHWNEVHWRAWGPRHPNEGEHWPASRGRQALRLLDAHVPGRCDASVGLQGWSQDPSAALARASWLGSALSALSAQSAVAGATLRSPGAALLGELLRLSGAHEEELGRAGQFLLRLGAQQPACPAPGAHHWPLLGRWTLEGGAPWPPQVVADPRPSRAAPGELSALGWTPEAAETQALGLSAATLMRAALRAASPAPEPRARGRLRAGREETAAQKRPREHVRDRTEAASGEHDPLSRS